MKPRLMGWLCLGVLLLQACAGIGLSDRTPESAGVRDPAAVAFFEELDRVTQQHGVHNASRFPVDGFPYLGTDRFLSALKYRIEGNDQEQAWIDRLRQMDLASRQKEIANLPLSALTSLAGFAEGAVDRETVLEMTRVYGERLLASDRSQPDFKANIAAGLVIPDEYSTLMRWLGFYPLAGIPVTVATTMANNRYRTWHQTPPEALPLQGRIEYFEPPPVSRDSLARLIADRYAPGQLDPLGLPRLDPEQLQLLAGGFAPIISQDVAAGYDRFGRVSWRRNRVFIDGTRPTVYFYLSHAFFDGLPVLQLNYAMWYTQRAGNEAPWFEKGPLDGLTVRVTLDTDGAPVMVDIMNNCGCYHFFVPAKERIRGITPRPGELEPLIPAWMPAEFPGQPIQLRLSSGWHQVQHIQSGNAPPHRTAYELVPYQALESLPKQNDRHESVFSPEGIMKDSWRIEPYIFFSMGVPKVGYMRQRGHHAVTLLNRAHFTDPFLFDAIFAINRKADGP